MKFAKLKEWFSIFSEVWYFAKTYRKWWLALLIISLVFASIFFIITESSVFAPLIYAIF